MKLNLFILKLISLADKSKHSKGFTLTELLIAASLTLVVVGAAGFGLYQTMRFSKTGNNQAERRSEIARAYEFISNEMRRARLIEDDSNIATDATAFNSTGKEVVLVLKIPVDTNVDNDSAPYVTPNTPNKEANVIYYVSNPPSGSAWQGPNVLYRWGPPINNGGEYDTGSWQGKPLIDQLDSASVSPSCASGWTTSNAPGFAACIASDGKIAQIYLNGEIVTAGGDETYQSNTKTTARANNQTAINVTPFDGPTLGLGGEFKCQSSGATVDVNTELKIYTNPTDTTPASTETIKSGGSSRKKFKSTNRLSVTSTPTNCTASALPFQSITPVSVDIKLIDSSTPPDTPNYYDTTNAHPRLNYDTTLVTSPQILVLYDYYDISSYNTQFTGQQALKEYLKSKGVEFYVESGTETNKIKLNPKQLLLAFEIGQTSSTIGSPPVSNPGWDFQDNLVLVNVDAPDPPNP